MGGMATSRGVLAMVAGPVGAAVAAGAAAAAAATAVLLSPRGGMYVPSPKALRTSPLVTLPPLPDPARTVASTPADWEMDLADGIRANSGGTSRSGTAAAVVVEGEAVAGEAAAVAAGSTAAAAAAAPTDGSSTSATNFSNAATSSSSSTTTQMGVPTGRSLASSPAFNILATMPSSCASKSMVALSVSISQITSPAAKDEPSAIDHEDIVPVSIVGLRAGIGYRVWGG
mmetsp:Transcript_17285/g.37764  ORF Transcript_17285/g.37764 Transcript_17285/m.37764 type:complete len:229 (+) Transcript_17285:181-867(+)